MKLDKLLHFLVGAFITSAFLPFIGLYALVPCIVAAIGKELWDSTVVNGKRRGTPDTKDAIWTVVGGIFSIITFCIFAIIFL